MKCPNCGAVAKAGAECTYCGAAIPKPPPSAANPFAMLTQDSDGDGVPDIFEGQGTTTVTHKTRISTSYTYNDVTYGSLDEMPPEVRCHFDEGLDFDDPDPPRPPRKRPQPEREQWVREPRRETGEPRGGGGAKVIAILFVVAILVVALVFALS